MTDTHDHSTPTDYTQAAASQDPPAEKRSPWLVLIPIVVLALWFGYLFFVSRVLPSEETYPDGRRSAVGTVKRHGFFDYKRSGLWREYHRNGAVAGEGQYEAGEKVEESWEYWDEDGKPINTDRPAPKTKANEGSRKRM